jgi:hypothetical protein
MRPGLDRLLDAPLDIENIADVAALRLCGETGSLFVSRATAPDSLPRLHAGKS